jgi:hypothetical protein
MKVAQGWLAVVWVRIAHLQRVQDKTGLGGLFSNRLD